MNIKQLLGKRIREIRLKNRFTQEKLAELAAIEIPSLSNIENGKNYPNHETLEKISAALSVRPFELFLFEYYNDKDSLIHEMLKYMKTDYILTQRMYQYFLCIKSAVNPKP